MIPAVRGGAFLLVGLAATGQGLDGPARPPEESVREFYSLLDRYRDERLVSDAAARETARILGERASSFAERFGLATPLELVRRLEGFDREALLADREAAGRLAAAEASLRAGDTRGAEEEAGAAVALARRTDNPNRRGAAASLLARIEMERGAFAEAARHLEEAIEAFRILRSPRGEGSALVDLATARARAGRTDWREPIEEALSRADAAGDSRAPVLLRRGWLALSEGDRRPALADFRRALELLGGREEGPAVAECFLGIAEIHLAEGEVDLARAALGAAEGASERDPAIVLGCRQLRARLALAEGDPAGARRIAEGMLEPRPADPAVEATALLLAGVAAARTGDPTGWERRLEEAEAIARGRFPAIEASALCDRGTLANEAGEPARAVPLFEAAIALASPAGYEDLRAHALAGASAALLALGDLCAAIDRGSDAVGAFEGLIEERATGRGRDLLFAGGAREAFEATIRALLARGADGDAERAFELAERARARSLLDEVRTLGIDPLADLPAPLLARRSELAGRYRLLCAALEANPSPAAGERLRARLDETLEAWSALAREIARAPGSVGRLPAPARLAEVREYARERGAAVLLYFVGREASFLFVASGDGLRTIPLPPKGKLEPRLAAFLDAVRGSALVPQARDRIPSLAASLAEDLFPPEIRGEAPVLAVVPDGILEEVPFECVLEAGGRAARAVVGYAPSCAALLEMERRARARSGARSPVLVAGADLESLPSVAEEMRAVGASFPGREVIRLEGAACRKEALLEREAPLGVLHLALHGRSGPTRVGVQFHGEDGVLWPHEIFGISSAPDLVVLSGCSTGRGERIEAAGVLGLAHAFVLAGASRIVVTLWPVDDAAAAATMRRFYEGIAAERSPAEALALARDSMRGDPSTRLPFYWAPFVVVGPP